MDRRFFSKCLAAALVSTALHAKDIPFPKQFSVHIENPVYANGVLSTDEGGTVEAKGLRIQAKHIEYTDVKETQKIIAEGDLCLDLQGRIFVGKRLEYDFHTNTGVMYGGKTAFNLWYMGGDEIRFHSDNSFSIINAYITTSETDSHEWDILVKDVHIDKDLTLEAKNVFFRANDFPLLWLPYYTSDLHEPKDSPVRYFVSWDKGQGPQLSMRYRVFSWEDFSFFVRAGYRFFKGPQAAIESEYRSPNKRSEFLTKNFYAYDTFWNDDDPNKRRHRFRIQGRYDSTALNEKTIAHITWDKLSDRNMALDFKSDDFELNTLQRTQVLIRHFEKNWLTGLNFRPKLNSYQGFKQELPTVEVDVRPQVLGQTGVIFDNRFSAAYLDYSFSDDIDNVIPNFESGRFSTQNRLTRPFHLGGLVLAPQVGFDGIYYTSDKDHSSAFQAILVYNACAKAPLSRKYSQYTHIVEPFATFKGLTGPTVGTNEVFIFSLKDGFHSLNQLDIGVKNALYKKDSPIHLPDFRIDVHAVGFFSDDTYSKTFPKAYSHFEWNLENLTLFSDIAWNFQESVLEHANAGVSWTVNKYYAMDFEYRYRSKFDWRKDDHQNYILDVSRPISELENTPISDRRSTFLARLQLELAPMWTLQAEGHFGWGRSNEPGYSEAKVDLITRLNSAWLAKLTYMHTVRDDQFKVSFMMAEY